MTDLTIREERMNDVFVKRHIEGLPFPLVLHEFTGPDDFEPFHDHPWPFRSIVVYDPCGAWATITLALLGLACAIRALTLIAFIQIGPFKFGRRDLE